MRGLEYEGLVREWLEMLEQDCDLNIATFLKGRVDDVERERVLAGICDYLAHHYLLAKRAMDGMVEIAKVGMRLRQNLL